MCFWTFHLSFPDVQVADAYNIPNLFATTNRDVSSGTRISPFYIWVEEERPAEEEVGEHERRLLSEYRAREAKEAVQGGDKGARRSQVKAEYFAVETIYENRNPH